MKKESNIVISTHVYATGPAQDLKEYLILEKIERIFFIGHPLFYDKKLDGSGFEKYENGELIEKKYAKIKKIPEVISYIKHIMKSIRWVRKTGLKWDLFFFFFNLNALAGIVLRRFGRVKKVVYYVIDYNPKRFANPIINWIYHKVDQFCVKHSDETWNLSNRMKVARKKYFGFDKGNQVEVPIGIWFKRYKISKRSESPTLAFMGHVLKKQGVQHIIKAIPKIVKKIKNFKFLVIGGGDYVGALKKLSKDIGVEKLVEFTGFIESHKDVEKRLSAASAAAVIYEKYDEKGDLSFTYFADPGKLKSYMASGLPIVLTDVPHNAKEIERKECGKIVNTGTDNIANAVIEMMSDRKRLAIYQKNAREFAKKYDWDTVFSKNLDRVLKN